MKTMTRFLTLALVISTLNSRTTQEPFIISNNGVLIGSAIAGATGLVGGYFLMDHIQNPEQSETKKTSKFANSVAALLGGSASAYVVYRLLDNCTPASWYKYAQKEAAGVQGVAARYGVTSGDRGVEAARLVEAINLQNSRAEYPLIKGVKEMQEAVTAAEKLQDVISAVGAADPNLADLVGKLGETTAQHNAGLNRAIVTARADATYLTQQGLKQQAEAAARAAAIDAQKAAAQAAQAQAQQEQARAARERNRIEAAKLEKQRRNS